MNWGGSSSRFAPLCSCFMGSQLPPFPLQLWVRWSLLCKDYPWHKGTNVSKPGPFLHSHRCACAFNWFSLALASESFADTKISSGLYRTPGVDSNKNWQQPRNNIPRWLPDLWNNYWAVLFCCPYQSINLSTCNTFIIPTLNEQCQFKNLRDHQVNILVWFVCWPLSIILLRKWIEN